MQRNRHLIAPFTILIFALISGPLSARPANLQMQADMRQLSSPSAAQRLYELAYGLGNTEAASPAQLQQAVILLKAAMRLDPGNPDILPDLLSLLTKRQIYTETPESFLSLFEDYVDLYNKDIDLEITSKATQYLLDQLNSREEREKLIQDLLNTLAGKNPVLDSQLYTSLGLLMAEKADVNAASVAFMNACNQNKYNKLAFIKLAELIPDRVPPAAFLEHLRTAIIETRLNIEVALAFAQYLEQQQLYQTAADAYQHCADLFTYLYPSEPMPSSIHTRWALCCYNTQQKQHECLLIIEYLQRAGHSDLRTEAVAAKALEKIGNADQAEQILQSAELNALTAWDSETENQKSDLAYQLAWFYSFALPDSAKALNWANKAFSADPNSESAAAILAYSLVMNNQQDLAKLLIDKYKNNQIANLALAQTQLDRKQTAFAIQSLLATIETDPISIPAQQAKELLAQQGGRQLISPTDPNITLNELKKMFGQTIVPEFLPPDKIFSTQLKLSPSNSPASEFAADLAITNISPEPLIITDDAMFKGNIRLDAKITGDLNLNFPNLVSRKIQPALPLGPGRTLTIPLQPVTGPLRRMLLTYPQASLSIEFTVYFDPVMTPEGVNNRLVDVAPAKLVVKRPRVEISGKYLRNRLNSLPKALPNQKIKTAQLFISLLNEQRAMANRKPLYRYMYGKWMPKVLKSALLDCLAQDDWVVKLHILSDMAYSPVDYELTNAIAKNLNDIRWPVRLMTIFMLAKSQDKNFDRVLQWTAENDPDKLVRDMAVALGTTSVTQQPITTIQPQEISLEDMLLEDIPLEDTPLEDTPLIFPDLDDLQP